MKIAIIGAGAMGMGVASKLAREHKNLELHVFQNHDYISLGACGIPYFIGGDFQDPALLNARTTSDFKNEKNYQSKINFHLNHPVLHVDFDAKQLTYQDQKHTTKNFNYHKLVIATGARANIFSPFDHQTQPKNLFTITTKEDAINIKTAIAKAHKIVIIGGSFIGLEMVETCLKLKKSVTLIEVQDRLMANVFDQEFSDLIIKELTNKTLYSQPINLHLNTSVASLTIKNEHINSLVTTSKQTIACDLVLLATGFKPNTEFLSDTNIKFAPNQAITINEYGQVLMATPTSKNTKLVAYEDIYSGGDCATVSSHISQTTTYLPLATSASKIARVIAHNITHSEQKEKWPGTLGASIIRIKDLELARVGIKDHRWESNNISSVFVASHDIPSYFTTSKPLYLKLFYDKISYQILAAQMAGYNKAVLRINALATAIWNKMDVRELQYLDLVYAPPFATTSDIIHVAARKIK